jgi:hypothetical protein
MRALAVISLTIGCSQTPPPPAPTCTPDTCQRALDFTAGPDLPAAMDHHATALATTGQGAFLYVLGGNDYSRQFRTVWVAALSKDGTAGGWVAARPLPEARAGHGVAVANGRIIVIAGQSRGVFLTTVFSSAVQPDGTLGPWDSEPSLPDARFHAYAATTADSLYVTGGVNPNYDATDTVYRAGIGADGRLTPFSAMSPMPTPRSHHAAAVHDGWLYLAGGLTGNPTTSWHDLAEVWASPILSDGSLGPFATVANVTPAATLSQFVFDGAWYLVGGLDDRGHYSSDIRRLAFGPGGSLGAAELILPGLPIGRSHVHQTPIYNDHFYSVGGSVAYQSVTAALQVGTFSWQPNPVLGN